MPIKAINDFVVKFANVNGSGSASANEMFARSVLRMGVPVTARNIFPSNIQGLPTWYEVRVSGKGWLGRRGGVDMMVQMNPQTWDKDIAAIDPGGYLFYDSTKPLPAVEIPRRRGRHRHAADRDRQRRLHRCAPAPAVQEHHLYRRAVGRVRDRDRGGRKADPPAIRPQEGTPGIRTSRPFTWAARLRREEPRRAMRAARSSATMRWASASSSRATTPRGWAACSAAPPWPRGIRSRRRPRWPKPLPSTASGFASIPKPGKNNYAIIQAEDEIAAIGAVIGAGWNGARAFTATSGPGISLMNEFLGLAYYAEVPAVIFNVQRGGPSTGMPTRTQQADLISLRLCQPRRHQARDAVSRKIRASCSSSPRFPSTSPSVCRRRSSSWKISTSA